MCFISDNFDFFVFGNHFVFEIPAGATAELRYHDVTVAKEIDVESDMRSGL